MMLPDSLARSCVINVPAGFPLSILTTYGSLWSLGLEGRMKEEEDTNDDDNKRRREGDDDDDNDNHDDFFFD